MAQTELTFDEVLESFNSFDREAIKRAFKSSLTSMLLPDTGDPYDAIVAAIFVLMRRAGDNDITAYNAAMNLTLAEVNTYFPEESVESGKGNTKPEQTPTD